MSFWHVEAPILNPRRFVFKNFKDATSNQTVKCLIFGRIWGDIRWIAMLLLERFLMQ